jgi:hypothetical protein
MAKIDFSKRIFVGLTGGENKDWQEKLKDINRLGITEVAVFLSRFDKKERDNFFPFLLKSTIKYVPLVHLRDDNTVEDIRFFIKNFRTKHFNIHENNFNDLDKWKKYWKNLYLEMNYDDNIAKNVKVKKIGGFCIDLAHFKSAIFRGVEEATYAHQNKNKIKFACNHLNGFSNKLIANYRYSEKGNDVHRIRNIKDFDYLTTLPKFVFGKIIALEMENSIPEQLKFKDHLVKVLNKYFNEN